MNREMTKRPASLLEVSLATHAGYEYVCAVKEFIDDLILGLEKADFDELHIPVEPEAYQAEPVHLRSAVLRAHLGGMAEHLAHLGNQPRPAWVEKPEYFLSEPIYLGGESVRDLIIRETPSAFRRRLLYCGKPLLKLHVMWERKQHDL